MFITIYFKQWFHLQNTSQNIHGNVEVPNETQIEEAKMEKDCHMAEMHGQVESKFNSFQSRVSNIFNNNRLIIW